MTFSFILDSVEIIIRNVFFPLLAYPVPITEVLLHKLLVTFSESSGLVKNLKYSSEWEMVMLLYKTAERK